MGRMTYSMRNHHSTHFILCHSKVNQVTSRASLRSNKEDSKSIMICLEILDKTREMDLSFMHTSQWFLNQRQQISKHIKALSLLAGQSFKPRKCKLFNLVLFHLILKRPIRRTLSSIN